MSNQVFHNRERVKKQLDLPGKYTYRFVGTSSPAYHAKVEEIVARVVGNNNIRRRSFRASKRGNYTSYRFEVFHMDFQEVEQIYSEVGELEGTRFLL